MQAKTDSNYYYRKEWDAYITAGDIKSLEAVYNCYFDVLFNYGCTFNCESQCIEDAIQNVFITLIKKQQQLTSVDNPHAYILTAFRNEILQLLIRNKRIHLHEHFKDSVFTPESSPEEVIIQDETKSNLQSTLKSGIKKLSPGQQEIIFMRFEAGLSYEDISRSLNISVESCRTAVYRAVKEIKRIVGSQDSGDRRSY